MAVKADREAQKHEMVSGTRLERRSANEQVHPARRGRRRTLTAGKLPGRFAPFLLLLPTLVIIAVFLYYPLFDTVGMSFYDVALLGRIQRFVGLGNYVEVFSTGSIGVVIRTAVISTLVIMGSMGSALGVAALLNQRIRGTKIYRLLLIWPLALSTAVSGLMFLAIFSPRFGPVNAILRTIGLDPQWFTEPRLAQIVIVVALIWTRFGYNLVFYSATYKNLPSDVLGAALVDGASAWDRFWHVTFPLLSPMTLFLFVTNTSFAFFDSFAMIHVMTQGGPLGSTTVMMYDVYQQAFQFRRTGFAAAQVMLLFLTVVGLMLIRLRFARRREL